MNRGGQQFNCVIRIVVSVGQVRKDRLYLRQINGLVIMKVN